MTPIAYKTLTSAILLTLTQTVFAIPPDEAEEDRELFRTKPVVSTVYFERNSGELAGMKNTILKPKYVLGTHNHIRFKALPDWHNSIDLRGYFGTVLSANEQMSEEGWQEIRGRIHSLYNLYNNSDVLFFNTGLYGLLAFPLHDDAPYVNPATNVAYAESEDKKLDREVLLGWDMNFDVKYDKSLSSFHNILYLTGKRVGPNLLAYRPALGFDWRHEVFFVGTKEQPKFSFFANIQFWFAKKADTSFFNTHDGIGGTKRELFLTYGFNYFFTEQTAGYIETYGYNNLNRGQSTTDPKGFRDGAVFGVRHTF